MAVRQVGHSKSEKMSATIIIKSLQVKDAEPRGMRDGVVLSTAHP
jgi:hypothetical protein